MGLAVAGGACLQFTTETDAGRACATFTGADDGFVVEVEVVHSCPPPDVENVINECELELDRRVLEISSVLRYQDMSNPRGVCGDPLDSTCELEHPVEAGEYIVRYGDQEATLQVQNEGGEVCP